MFGFHLCVCVSLGHFGFVSLVSFVGFSFFQYRAKRLAGKNVSKITYFVSSGTSKLYSVITQSVVILCIHSEQSGQPHESSASQSLV